jgi:hypothetical protein
MDKTEMNENELFVCSKQLYSSAVLIYFTKPSLLSLVGIYTHLSTAYFGGLTLHSLQGNLSLLRDVVDDLIRNTSIRFR